MRAEQVHCARCGDVVSLAHPWEAVDCRCGAVRVSGMPWRVRVDWHAAPPAGWEIVEDPAPCATPPTGPADSMGGGDGDAGSPPAAVTA